MNEENRKENVQLIVTLNQKGHPVYQDSAPALLNASLRRLQNILKGQVLHCVDEAYSACSEFHAAPHLLDMNGSHIDDITKMYREDNFDFQGGLHNHEIGHFMVDYQGSTLMLSGYKSQFIARGFVSRIHVAQYFDSRPDDDAVIGAGLLDEARLVTHGYALESSDWETLPYRAGGPRCAKLRHTVWRHASIPKHYPTLLSVDHPAGSVAAAQRSASDELKRNKQPERVEVVKPVITKPKRTIDQLDELTGYRRPVWK